MTSSDEGKEEDMRGAASGSGSGGDVIDGVQVSVLRGLVEGLSMGDNRRIQAEENLQGAVGGVSLPESARSLSAFRRPRQ